MSLGARAAAWGACPGATSGAEITCAQQSDSASCSTFQTRTEIMAKERDVGAGDSCLQEMRDDPSQCKEDTENPVKTHVLVVRICVEQSILDAPAVDCHIHGSISISSIWTMSPRGAEMESYVDHHLNSAGRTGSNAPESCFRLLLKAFARACLLLLLEHLQQASSLRHLLVNCNLLPERK